MTTQAEVARPSGVAAKAGRRYGVGLRGARRVRQDADVHAVTERRYDVPRTRRRVATALSAGLVLMMALSGCFWGDSGRDSGGASGRDAGAGIENSAADGGQPVLPALALRTGVTRVIGELEPAARKRLARTVDALVGRYLKVAFLDPRSRSDTSDEAATSRFPGFTPGARVQAVADRRLLTAASLRDADRVTPVLATAYVSVVAPQGKPVGATARLALDLRVSADEGNRPVRVRVRGRLLLTPTSQGWRIFGYDLAQSGAGPEGRRSR